MLVNDVFSELRQSGSKVQLTAIKILYLFYCDYSLMLLCDFVATKELRRFRQTKTIEQSSKPRAVLSILSRLYEIIHLVLTQNFRKNNISYSSVGVRIRG